MTGEENERNVAQISAKLYVFDKATSNWTEKGRGCLRLNDVKDESGHSRVVMRSAATFRVILNTKLFPGKCSTIPSTSQYRVTRQVESYILLQLIWGVPPACGPLLQLATAQAGRGNSPN